jgi:hypothetical protein
LLPAALRAQAPPGISGVYVGSYTCSQRQFQLQLQLQADGANALSGVWTFFYPGGEAANPLGAFRVVGTYDPQRNTFMLQHREWVKANPLFFPFGTSGTFDPASATMTGKLAAAGCSAFEARRDDAATAKAAQAAAQQASRYDNAPTALSQASTPAEQCLVLGKWFSRFRREYSKVNIQGSLVDQLYVQAANLFNDDDFVPVFGKRYEQLTERDRAVPRQAIAACRQTTDREESTMYGVVLIRPFLPGSGGSPGSFTAGDVAAMVAFRRSLRQKRLALLAELKQLTPSEQSLQRAQAIRDTELSEYEILWPSEYAELDAAANAAITRIATPVFESWIAATIKEASGYDGLTRISDALDLLIGRANAQRSNSRAVLAAAASPASRQQAEAKLRARGTALATELIAPERARLASLGTGLAALQAGTVWHLRVAQGFARFEGEPPVRAAFQELQARRRPELAASATELTARVRAAKTSAELATIMASYLGVPSDRDEPAASGIFVAAGEKDRAFAAAAEKAEAEARAVTTFCKRIPPGPKPIPAEPSATDLCLAVADIMDAMNEEWRSIQTACARGDYRTDRILGVQCLGLCLGSFMTCHLSVQMIHFEKVACAKPQGLAGFNCDYIMRWTASTASLNSAMGVVFPAGGHTRHRFIQRGDRWIRVDR